MAILLERDADQAVAVGTVWREILLVYLAIEHVTDVVLRADLMSVVVGEM